MPSIWDTGMSTDSILFSLLIARDLALTSNQCLKYVIKEIDIIMDSRLVASMIVIPLISFHVAVYKKFNNRLHSYRQLLVKRRFHLLI